MPDLKFLLIPATLLALAAAVPSAQARPRAISTDGGKTEPILGVPNGEVMAMFISTASGADADYIAIGGPGLTNDLPTPGTPIFCTQTISGTCAASIPGAVADLGKATPTGELPAGIFSSGTIQLVLVDTTTNFTFASNGAVESLDPTYGSGFVFQNWVTNDYADFGFGVLPAFAAAKLAGLPASARLQFIGWDNTVSCPDPAVNCDGKSGTGVDAYQYNDVVMALWSVGGTAVPEPVTLATFATGLAGLIGLGLRTRRKRHQKI